MNKERLMKFITEQYSINEEHPWIKYPSYAVFRHNNNQKWFALFMNISKSKLGLDSNDIIEALNVKCDPILIESLIKEKGIYPAYHMNKLNWITIVLDGSIEDDKIKHLINRSYELTKTKKKRK